MNDQTTESPNPPAQRFSGFNPREFFMGLLIAVTIVFSAAGTRWWIRARTTDRAATPQAAENAKAQETLDLKISGMTWPVNCPKRVRSALEKVPGVISAEVTHPDKAVVTVEKGKVTPSQLIAAVEEAGYGAKLNEPIK